MFQKSPSTDQFQWSPFEVFQVNISPDRVIRPAGFYMANPENPGKATYKDTYERIKSWAHHARFSSREYAKSYNTWSTYYNIIKSAPNLLTIVVGVLYKTKLHRGADIDILEEDGKEYFGKGEDIPYEDLFFYLHEGVNGKNFDPLIKIRDKHKEIEAEMLRKYNEIERKNRDSVKAAMESIAKKLYDEVMDYFDGSEKPDLSPMTVNRMRVAKQNANPSLYHSGIGEALIESGQLRDAINYQVFIEQTPDFKIQAEKEAHSLKKINAVQRNRNGELRRIESEIRKSKKKIEHNEDLEAIRKYVAQSAIMKEVLSGSEVVKNKKKKPAKSVKQAKEDFIVKMYEVGMLRGMKFKYARGTKTYREIVEQNMKYAKGLSAMWEVYAKGHDEAIAQSKKSGDMGTYYNWRRDLERAGMMPEEKELKLMEAAYEILNMLGNTEK